MFPGRNTQHQLQLIIDCLGNPEKDVLQRIPNEKCKTFIESLPASSARQLSADVPNACAAALDILAQLLHFNPEHRPIAEKCLEHKYIELLHCPEDEPLTVPLKVTDFEFERRKIDIEALREEIYQEALSYKPEAHKNYLAEQSKKGQAYDIEIFRMLNPGESQYTSDEEEGAM